jgi:hypothetical protein
MSKFSIHDVPFRWLSEEDKLEKIKADMSNFTYFKEFAKAHESHLLYLGRLFSPSKSEEGKKKYDDFLSSLISTKKAKTYNEIVELALTTECFTDFVKDYPVEYDYCSRSSRKWLSSLRLEVEEKKPGWDNGKRKPTKVTV